MKSLSTRVDSSPFGSNACRFMKPQKNFSDTKNTLDNMFPCYCSHTTLQTSSHTKNSLESPFVSLSVNKILEVVVSKRPPSMRLNHFFSSFGTE